MVDQVERDAVEMIGRDAGEIRRGGRPKSTDARRPWKPRQARRHRAKGWLRSY